MGKDKLLKRFNLILEGHKICNGFVSTSATQRQECSPLIGIVDVFETDILLIFEQSVELRVMAVEA